MLSSRSIKARDFPFVVIVNTERVSRAGVLHSLPHTLIIEVLFPLKVSYFFSDFA